MKRIQQRGREWRENGEDKLPIPFEINQITEVANRANR